MAVGIGEDDVALGVSQVGSGIIAALVLRHVVLEGDVGHVDAKLLAGLGDALDVGHVVAGVLVVDADDADLDVGSGGAGTASPVSPVSLLDVLLPLVLPVLPAALLPPPPQATRASSMTAVSSRANSFFIDCSSFFISKNTENASALLLYRMLS